MIFFKKKTDIIHRFQYFIILLLPLLLILGNAYTNAGLTLFVLLFLCLTFIQKNFLIYKNFYLKILLFFWIYLILNSLFINFSGEKLLKSIFFIRFLILPFALIYFFQNKLFNKKIIFYFYSFFFLLFSMDLIFQFWYGENILGFLPEMCTIINNKKICERYSGFFGNELIAGSYLLLFSLPSMIFLMRFRKNIKYSNFLFLLVVSLVFAASFFTGDRTPLLILMMACFVFFLFIKLKFIKKIFIILIFFIIIFLTIYFTQHLKHRFITYPITQINSNSNLPLVKKFFFETHWGIIYVNSFEIFKDNMLFGKGIKSFRHECKKYDLEYLHSKYKANNSNIYNKENGCTTHPHNLYLELLAETGIFGFLFFIFFLLNLILKTFQKNRNNYLFLALFSLMLGVLFPFRPSGSFFSTWSAYIMWIQFSFYLHYADIKVFKYNLRKK